MQNNLFLDDTMEGSSFLSVFLRKGPSPEVRNTLKQYGDQVIVGIRACRRPLEKYLRIVANALTKGRINKHLEDYGYDDLYHLYTLVELANGKTVMVDKQEVVNAKVVPSSYTEPNQECHIVPMSTSAIQPIVTLAKYFANGEQYFKTNPETEKENFWMYDAFDNNCQIFVNSLLMGSSIQLGQFGGPIDYSLSSELGKFIMQNVRKITKKTDIVSRVASVLTDAGGLWNRISKGSSLPQEFYIKPHRSLLQQVHDSDEVYY